MANDYEKFLTPGSDQSVVTGAAISAGSPALQAYSAEYNGLGVKTNLVIPLTQTPSGNNAGIKSVVGGIGFQTTQDPVSSSGNVQSSANMGYEVGVGWWIGFDQGTPKLFIGDENGDNMKWTGTALIITGEIDATTGVIGGFTIGATTLSATSGGNTTILSSGSTAFSAGPTGNPSITITQAGDFNLINSSGHTVVAIKNGTTSSQALLTITPQDVVRGALYITTVSGNNQTVMNIDSAGTAPALTISSTNTSNAATVFGVTSAGSGVAVGINTDSSTSLNTALAVTARPDIGSFSNAAGLSISLSASSVGNGIYINHPATSLGRAVNISRTAASGSTQIRGMTLGVAHSGSGVATGFDLTVSSSTGDSNALVISNSGLGTSPAILISQANSSNGGVISAIKIQSLANAGTGGTAGIDFQNLATGQAVMQVTADGGGIGAISGRIAIRVAGSATTFYIPYYPAA